MQAQEDSFSYFFLLFSFAALEKQQPAKVSSSSLSSSHRRLSSCVFFTFFQQTENCRFSSCDKKNAEDGNGEREREKLKPMLISFSFHLKMFDYKQAENLQSLLYLFSVTYSKVFSTFLLFPIYSKS